MTYQIKLLPEIKKLWVDALRSGLYKQGHNDLLDAEGGYCCLGVLVTELDNEIIRLRDDPYGYCSVVLPDGKTVASAGGVLPEELLPQIYGQVENKHNLQAYKNPFVRICNVDGDDAEYMLSELNDDVKFTFNQIADVIEEQL